MYRFLNQRGTIPVHDYTCSATQAGIESKNPKTYDVPRALRPIYDTPSKIGSDYSYSRGFLDYPNGEAFVAGSQPIGGYRSPLPFLGLPINIPAKPVSNQAMADRYGFSNSDIQYYVDSDLAQPYYSPVYAMPSVSKQYDYVDPMSSWKPHYTFQVVNPERFSCLSWLNDSSFQREDIIAHQQAKYNQTRSEMFF